jgi:putative OPT family oligopeptide transporter
MTEKVIALIKDNKQACHLFKNIARLIAMKHNHELTFRVIILSILLTIILAVSNAYMALKIGILTSASIPAAILSMGILRFFKNSTILENNLVQTAASAGEAVAGGIVYTIPALIIIHYWYGFSYWENFWIALIGGVLGVLFSIPLRRFLVTDKTLPFPEGAAIAEVLKISGDSNSSFRSLIQGGAVGALIELCQTGFKIIASQWQTWWTFVNSVGGNTIAGFGVGFSSTLIGAGYLIGYNLGLSILIGAILSWIIGIPIISQFFPDIIQATKVGINTINNASDAAGYLWSTKLRYVAIGTMLTAGIGVAISLIWPLIRRFRKSLENLDENKVLIQSPHEKDIPWYLNLLGVLIMGVGLVFLLKFILPLDILSGHSAHSAWHSFLILLVALLHHLKNQLIFQHR